jgi:hypothetical protein
MKHIVGIAFISLFLFTACKNDSELNQEVDKKESMYNSIKVMEDSIQKMSASNTNVPNLHNLELINRLIDFQKEFPGDEKAPLCLDKAHMVYSKMNLYDKAAVVVDTILVKYPSYSNRLMLLESQAGSYDIFITPRDTNKVKHYYSLLLKEDKEMDAETKEGIENRLKHIHLSFDEYIELLNQESMMK